MTRTPASSPARPPDSAVAPRRRRLAALCGLTLWANGCASLQSTTEFTSLPRQRTAQQRAPELDELHVDVRLQGDLLRLSVQHRVACRTHVIERARRTTRQRPGAEGLSADLIALGFGGWLTYEALRPRSDDADSAGGPGPLVLVGPVTATVAVVALLVDLGKFDSSSHVIVDDDPALGVRVEGCASAPPARVVALDVPGSPTLSAPVDASGRALILIPAGLWPDDGRLDVEIRVDGVLVRRALLSRGAP